MKITWIGSPNHTAGRGGHKIDHITLHIMAGTLAGTDAHFKNPNSQVSATYGIGANGEIHQYVSENDTPWSDGNALSNATGISIEHQGGLAGIPCTRACMDASAQLCADIARRHGWKRLEHVNSDAGNIYLHREVYGSTHSTCPDHAPNGLDVNYVINKANEILGNKNTNNNGGNNMAVDPKGVWEYHYSPDKDKRNMYNRIVGILANLQTLLKRTENIPASIWEYHYKGDKRNLNMYNKITRALDLLESIDRKLK